MRQIFLMLKQSLHKALVLTSLVSLIYTTGFFLVAPSSYADTSRQSVKEQPFILDDPQPATNREAAYEDAIKEVKEPDGLEKEYEKDLKTFKQEHPDENPVVEGAKELVDKVTGK